MVLCDEQTIVSTGAHGQTGTGHGDPRAQRHAAHRLPRCPSSKEVTMDQQRMGASADGRSRRAVVKAAAGAAGAGLFALVGGEMAVAAGCPLVSGLDPVATAGLE